MADPVRGLDVVAAAGGEAPLTARRVLVIRHLAHGRRPPEIARLLGIARDSVYEHPPRR